MRPGSPARRSLSGPALEEYAATASRLVLAGRLNRFFPDPYAASAYLACLAPSVRGEVYGAVALEPSSGLPGLRELVTLEADRKIAAGFAAECAERQAAGKTLTPRLSAKLAYYRRLQGRELPPLTALAARLRRVDAARGIAAFEVVFDRFDAAESVFVRYTLHLEQEERSWANPLLERTGDYSRQTEEFRLRMERVLSDESELAFLILGRLPGVRLEEIARGRIGPLWSPACPGPAGWWPAGGWVLHLPLDRASIRLAGDRDDDPFAGSYRDALSAASRPLVDEAALQLGYHVHKERKFACAPEAAEALAARLARAGARCLVYAA